jgi:HAD superfamily hydrolase (TIGR01509 family)
MTGAFWNRKSTACDSVAEMKVLLLDVDGVLQFHDKLLEEKFEREFSWKTTHREFLRELFSDPDYLKMQTGEADFFQVADRILPRHVEDLDATKYFEIWSNGNVHQNNALLDLLPDLPVAYLATNQEQHRGKVIESLYAPYVEGTFVSYKMGVRKPAIEYFELILQQLGIAPEDCTFVDDIQPNVDAGQATGIRSILFQSNEQLFADFRSIGILS